MGRTAEEILRETVSDPVMYIEEDWRSISDDALLLVRGMLVKNPEERLSMKEVMSCSWVTHPRLCGKKDNLRRASISDRQLCCALSLPTTLPGNGVHLSLYRVCPKPFKETKAI